MEMFGDLNFTILGFSCNQFGLQAPGKSTESLGMGNFKNIIQLKVKFLEISNMMANLQLPVHVSPLFTQSNKLIV